MKNLILKNKGFTLIEILVVVLIIGILAAIALPKYQMAVTKAKVASILPIMRRWKDALMEYNLQHGNYEDENGIKPDGGTLGVNWPSDWKENDYDNNTPCGDNIACKNDYWNCYANGSGNGLVYCIHDIDDDNEISIDMPPTDWRNEIERNKILCEADGDKAHKVCKALGGKLTKEDGHIYILY